MDEDSFVLYMLVAFGLDMTLEPDLALAADDPKLR